MTTRVEVEEVLKFFTRSLLTAANAQQRFENATGGAHAGPLLRIAENRLGEAVQQLADVLVPEAGADASPIGQSIDITG